jgi:hypothetical protein
MGKRMIDGWERMAVLPVSERIARLPGQFVFMEFNTLESFSLKSADESHGRYDIDIVLRSEKRLGGDFRLHLRFIDISGLICRAGAGGLVQIMGLTIDNIADRQWERQNRQIGQIEDSELSFRAADVQIAAIDAV